MSLELGARREREANSKPYCLFISGGMGTNAGIRGIKQGLEQQYGVGKVEAFNSVLNFKDPQNPKRFEQMADFIQQHAKEGLDIVAHSLGAAELRKAIEIVKKKDAGFFDNKENTKNLHIVLVSPSGFNKGKMGFFKYMRKAFKHYNQEMDVPVVSQSKTLLRGIHALTAFPPVGVPSEDLILALRKIMPELSHYKEEDTLSVFLQGEQHNFDELSDVQKGFIISHSKMISFAIKSGKDSDLRALVISYGEELRKPLAQVFAGNFESGDAQVQEATRAMMGGVIGWMSTVIDGFGSKPMRKLAELQQKGVRVDLLIPEYDVFMNLQEAIAFFEGSDDALKQVTIVEGVAHAFPALRARGFGEMIGNLNKGKSS